MSELSQIKQVLQQDMVEPEHQCWFEDTDIADAGESYCYDCAVKKMPDEVLRDEHLHMPGYAMESECVVVCESCGTMLSYDLISSDSELEHFEHYPPNSLDGDMRYALWNLARAIRGTNDESLAGRFVILWQKIESEADDE